jgi:hypothetical protein
LLLVQLHELGCLSCQYFIGQTINCSRRARQHLVSILYGILDVPVSIANLQIAMTPLVFSAAITEYLGMAQGRYEGMTFWIPPKPSHGNKSAENKDGEQALKEFSFRYNQLAQE